MQKELEFALDVDGVLGDFVSASLEIHNRPESHDDCTQYDYYENWPLTAQEFWKPIHDEGMAFWAGIEPYPWAQELYGRLSELGKVTISTSPNNDVYCASGKALWLEEHLGIRPKDCMIGSRKDLFVGNAILIDDSEHNGRKFISKGGECFLFPRPWNCANGSWLDIVGMAKRAKEKFDAS